MACDFQDGTRSMGDARGRSVRRPTRTYDRGAPHPPCRRLPAAILDVWTRRSPLPVPRCCGIAAAADCPSACRSWSAPSRATWTCRSTRIHDENAWGEGAETGTVWVSGHCSSRLCRRSTSRAGPPRRPGSSPPGSTARATGCRSRDAGERRSRADRRPSSPSTPGPSP